MSLPPISTDSGKASSILDIVKSGQGLLDIFAGKTVSGATSQTTQTALSPEAVQALLNQILGGTQGLATVSSGQKGAGIYNSSVNTLLTNDLLSRAAGEVAVKSAPTTTSGTTKQVQQPQMNFGNSLVGLGVSLLGNKVLKATGADKSIDKIIQSGFNLFKDPTTLESTNFDLGAAQSFGGDTVTSAAPDVSSFLSSPGTDAVVGDAGLNSIGDASSLYDASSVDFSNFAADGVGDTALDLGSDAISGGVPVVGPVLRLLQGDAGGAAGSAVGGAIGSTFGPIGTVVGSTLGGAIGGDSVVCTECYNRGDMPEFKYLASSWYGKYNQIAREGYHIWGIPLVRVMKRSRRIYRICSYLANCYASHIVGEGSIIGATMLFIGYPICWTLGKIKQWHKQILTPAH